MKRLLFLLALLSSITSWAQNNGAITQAMDNYDYQTVIDLIDRQEPNSQLLFLKAKAHKGLYQYNEAVRTLEQSIKLSPDNQQLLLEMGECCKLAGKFNDALQSYEKILNLNPDHTYAQIQYINLLMMLDKYPLARKACDEVLQRDSSVVFVRLMAQCHEGLLESLSARDWYKKAVELTPNDYFVVSKLASLYNQTNDSMLAIEVTEKFRQNDSTNIYVNRQNAQAYCLIQQYDDAIKRYEKLLEQGDKSRMTTYYAGICYFVKENFYEAHDCLEIALKYDEKNVNVLYYLARACAKTSWKKEGVEYMKQALEYTIPSNENLAQLYTGLAECYHHNREWKNYVETLKLQHKYDPQKHVILYRLGAAYQDLLKDNKNAERYLEMFLKTKPKDTEDSDSAMEGGTLVIGASSTYKAAESRLNDIRTEKFFNPQ